MTGRRVGRLVVIDRCGSNARGVAEWVCVCDCGALTVARGDDLRLGTMQSCSCFAKEQRANAMRRKFGHYPKAYAMGPARWL